MTLSSSIYVTPSGIKIERRVCSLDVNSALTNVKEGLKTQAGAIFASGYEYPGRYNRWDVGFYNPPLELIASGRTFSLNARNEKGTCLITWFQELLSDHPHLLKLEAQSNQSLTGYIQEMPTFFPEEERSRQPSIFSVLRTLQQSLFNSEEQHLGFYGAFGYDLVFQFDPIEFKHSREGLIDTRLFLPDEITVVDRRMDIAYRLEYEFTKGKISTKGMSKRSNTSSTIHSKAGEAENDHVKGEYADKVRKIQNGCKRGDYFEVVLSQVFKRPFEGDAIDVFHRIQKRNPSPYEFIIQFEDEQLVGASPEMFVRVEGNRVETCPISGTIGRGESPLEDADQIKALLSSKKEEAELTMCTDVDRNDKSRVCKPESVQVLGRRMIELYSKVIHTVDHVVGELKENFDGLDAFLSHMWAVTLCGSPKKAAMQEIENMEKSSRKWYGGAVGMLSFNGNINTGITIRTVHLKDGQANIRVGATLLAASDADSEEIETELKAAAFIQAVTADTQKVKKHLDIYNNGVGKKVLFVDHQDSFVHTLAGYVRRTGAEVLTLRSGFPMNYLNDFKPDLVFLSPGPFTPTHFQLPELIKKLMEMKLPIFGVCLGMQGMIEALGGSLAVLDIPQHGVHANILHEGEGIFKNLPNPLSASRYHSLYGVIDQLPNQFKITAKSDDGILMGVQHQSYPMAGIQFHPESIHSLRKSVGLKLINNMMDMIPKPL